MEAHSPAFIGSVRLDSAGEILVNKLSALLSLIFRAWPAGILGMVLSADPNDRANEDKRTVGFLFAAIMGGPLALTLVYQQTRAFRRRRLYQAGEFIAAPITEAKMVIVRSGSAQATTLQLRWRFEKDGTTYVGGFAPDPLQLGAVPFRPGTGDTAILVVDPARPKRHEAYGFIQGTRAWWPGQS